jgi:hypothetical protein
MLADRAVRRGLAVATGRSESRGALYPQGAEPPGRDEGLGGGEAEPFAYGFRSSGGITGRSAVFPVCRTPWASGKQFYTILSISMRDCWHLARRPGAEPTQHAGGQAGRPGGRDRRRQTAPAAAHWAGGGARANWAVGGQATTCAGRHRWTRFCYISRVLPDLYNKITPPALKAARPRGSRSGVRSALGAQGRRQRAGPARRYAGAGQNGSRSWRLSTFPEPVFGSSSAKLTDLGTL